jgi:hypothetical protein
MGCNNLVPIFSARVAKWPSWSLYMMCCRDCLMEYNVLTDSSGRKKF